MRLGIPPDRIHGYYDVVDNEYFATGTALLRSSARPATYALPEKYFLFVGRLAPEKNIETLIEAYSLYHANGGEWHLLVVGDGPLRSKLGDTQTTGTSSAMIHFAGFRNGDELLPYYAFAGCFILPSLKEAWGLVVNEAMAARLPVLVSQNCGCSDDLVKNGVNGFVFNPRDPVQLASLMHDITSFSESMRCVLGKRSWEFVSKYSPQAFASEVRRIVDAEVSKT
jgi:glycosyltransferase involved in cell wall biosynthesis